MPSLPTIVALSLLAGVTVMACVQRSQPAQPSYAYGPAGARCIDGPPTCGADGRGVAQCQRGAWVGLQACNGPRGCAIVGGAIQCDTGASAPAPGPAANGAGQPCAAEGGYECTPDRRALTICRGGRTIIASTCRGAKGCVSGSAVNCDHSVAAVGDPCEAPTEIACSTDKKQLLRCVGSRYQVGEPCRNACLSTGGRVLCQ